MSHYGAWIVARSPDRLLPNMPELRAAFGSHWNSLWDLANGWQLLVVIPDKHEWPVIEPMPVSLASVLDLPWMAAWVSESECVRFVGYIDSVGHSRNHRDLRKSGSDGRGLPNSAIDSADV